MEPVKPLDPIEPFNPPRIIETERLWLRPFVESDAEHSTMRCSAIPK